MERAAVLIGVSRTGGLPELPAVETAIERMRTWAEAQGIPKERILVISDTRQPEVTVQDVSFAIAALPPVEQLIVYFCGHGIVYNLHETWLLTRAQEFPTEAVDLGRSEILAWRSPFRHVVFISDACRTAAPGTIRGQSLQPTPVFPSGTAGVPSREVDVFYASLLGDPAYQVEVEGTWAPVYTDVLVTCLEGNPHTLVAVEDQSPFRRGVRPRPLKEHLAALTLTNGQTPDARVSSGPTCWISLLANAVPDGTSPPNKAPKPPQAPPSITDRPRQADRVASNLVSEVARGNGGDDFALGSPGLAHIHGDAAIPIRRVFDRAWKGELARRRPVHRPSSIGLIFERFMLRFKLEPTPMTEVFLREFDRRLAQSEPAGGVGEGFVFPADVPVSISSRGPLRQEGANWQHLGRRLSGPTQALIEFSDGCLTLLPLLPGFIATVAYENSRIDHVSYEPVAGPTAPSAEILQKARMLRALASTATSLGVMHLDGHEGESVMALRQGLQFCDPSLALYTAYAYHDIGRADLVAKIHRHVRRAFDVDIYDLAVLSGGFGGRRAAARVTTPAPLMGRGWGVHDLLGGCMPDDAFALKRHLKNSLWSVYDADALPILRSLI